MKNHLWRQQTMNNTYTNTEKGRKKLRHSLCRRNAQRAAFHRHTIYYPSKSSEQWIKSCESHLYMEGEKKLMDRNNNKCVLCFSIRKQLDRRFSTQWNIEWHQFWNLSTISPGWVVKYEQIQWSVVLFRP